MGNEKLGQLVSCCKYDFLNDRHHPDCPVGKAMKGVKPKNKGYNPKYDHVIDKAIELVNGWMGR